MRETGGRPGPQPEAGAAADPLQDRSRFAVWTTDRLRLVDLDFQRHVNNVAYAVFCANGRYSFMEAHVRPHIGRADVVAVAKVVIDYLGEMSYPGDVEVGTLVRSVGRTSFTFGQGLFKDGKCVGTSESVMVLLDPATRRAKPLPPRVRAHLAQFMETPPA